jgi:hypothetical protein
MENQFCRIAAKRRSRGAPTNPEPEKGLTHDHHLRRAGDRIELATEKAEKASNRRSGFYLYGWFDDGGSFALDTLNGLFDKFVKASVSNISIFSILNGDPPARRHFPYGL